MLRPFVPFLLALILSSPTVNAQEKKLSVREITLEGLREKILENKGKVLILYFWDTLAAPCKEEIPFLNELYQTYKDKGLEIIGISVEGVGEEVVRPFAEMMGINHPIFLGGDDIIEAYDVQYIPLTYIVGKDGRVSMKEIGFRKDTTASKFKRLIEELLRERQQSY